MSTPSEILNTYWGHQAFRPLQEEIIQSLLSGHDTLALLPTGGGKSICFQVPTMLKEGICLVVSPLIALMKDQVENLKAKGIAATTIYSGMSKREIDIKLDNCVFGKIKFLYLSPERLLSDLVKTRISYMNVCLIAIDEAHCVSQWGYDFRPPYLQIAKLRDLLPNVPLIALTATATNKVREDLVDKLAMRSPSVYVKSFARHNLSYVVYNLDDKLSKLLSVAQSLKGSGLVYVRNRRETVELANFLLRNQISADYYHAGLESTIRFAKQENWKKNRTRIMVATNAFGMGIDKPDVRFVVHMDLPESLEAYYQEAGRAGRDEKKAYAVLLCNNADIDYLNLKFDQNFPSIEEIKVLYQHLGNFFQLAYGAGKDLNMEFDIAAFCKQYQLSVPKTLASFKFLERDELISLSESTYHPSRLMFLLKYQDVYEFQVKHFQYDHFIKTILRSYGGALFEDYLKISESDLAQRCGLPYQQVIKFLIELDKIGVLSYLPQSDQPRIQFLSPRLDKNHLSIDQKFLNFRKEVFKSQIDAVIGYTRANRCRSTQLLSYFNEKNADKCGICDYCLKEKRIEHQQNYWDNIEYNIVTALQGNSLDLQQLLKAINTAGQQDKLDMIRQLLDAGKIKSDGHKYYL